MQGFMHTTVTQEAVSRVSGNGETSETGMIGVLPASGGGNAGSNPAGAHFWPANITVRRLALV